MDMAVLVEGLEGSLNPNPASHTRDVLHSHGRLSRLSPS
jgi:hypothetical protein